MPHTNPRVIAPLTAATLIAPEVGGTGIRDGLFLSHFPVKAFRISWQVQPSSRSLHHSSRDGCSPGLARGGGSSLVASSAALFLVEWFHRTS